MYGWTLDLDEIKRSVDWQLSRLKTDYIDFGFIHCIDEDSDLAAAQDGGTIDYLLSLKRQGVVRHIGMSTHTPESGARGAGPGHPRHADVLDKPRVRLRPGRVVA